MRGLRGIDPDNLLLHPFHKWASRNPISCAGADTCTREAIRISSSVPQVAQECRQGTGNASQIAGNASQVAEKRFRTSVLRYSAGIFPRPCGPAPAPKGASRASQGRRERPVRAMPSPDVVLKPLSGRGGVGSPSR